MGVRVICNTAKKLALRDMSIKSTKQACKAYYGLLDRPRDTLP